MRKVDLQCWDGVFPIEREAAGGVIVPYKVAYLVMYRPRDEDGYWWIYGTGHGLVEARDAAERIYRSLPAGQGPPEVIVAVQIWEDGCYTVWPTMIAHSWVTVLDGYVMLPDVVPTIKGAVRACYPQLAADRLPKTIDWDAAGRSRYAPTPASKARSNGK